MGKRVLAIGIGLIFSILWASASAATKIGLRAVQPFTICVVRFFLAGLLMIFISHLIMRKRLPTGKEWGRIALYGLLTNSIYLGLFVIAMLQVSPGLGTLGVATNPVFINLLTALILRQRLKWVTLVSLVLCMGGVVLAAWPLLRNSTATPAGLLILMVGMLAYSIGVFYFSRMNWEGLHLLTINGWQVFFGGLFLLPFALFMYRPELTHWNADSIGGILWLAIPVSIGAVQLWLYLIREDAARASFWLFLCPVFGFLIAHMVTGEIITWYTFVGMALVIGGVYWLHAKAPRQVVE